MPAHPGHRHRERTRRGVALAAAAAVAGSLMAGPAVRAEVTLLSTQFGRAAEAASLRDRVLADFGDTVMFRPMSSYAVMEDILRAPPPGTSMVVGAYHGQLVSLWKSGLLDGSLPSRPWFAAAGFDAAAVAMSRLGADEGYVPWVFASYMMVANRTALRHLPPGATVENLTYDQLLDWGARLAEATGKPQIGLPFGEDGLGHRFLQGFLLPSFTGALLRRFRSAEAESMWRYAQALWPYVDGRSLSYDNMSVPLESEDVMVGWDHSARLSPLFEADDGDFVAFAAPVGPKGRGHMMVPVGLAPGRDPAGGAGAEALIRHLTRADVQRQTVTSTGFLPVIAGETSGLPEPTAQLVETARRQAGDSQLRSLPPGGLGGDGELFDTLFIATFSDIVLSGRDIGQTMRRYGDHLDRVLQRNATPCWAPDPPSGNAACRTE